jgi:hypothetical protein
MWVSEGAIISLVDATGFSFRARTATIWAPIGQTPVRRMSKRRACSTAVGLTWSCDIDKCHLVHAIQGADIVAALRHCLGHLKAHRATVVVVKEYVAAHPAMAERASTS